MNIYLLYALTLILTIILFVIIKDKIKALKVTGIITLSSSLFLITLALIVKIILNTNITSINISVITNYIFLKFINTSLTLFIIGLIEILISKYINAKRVPQE